MPSRSYHDRSIVHGIVAGGSPNSCDPRARAHVRGRNGCSARAVGAEFPSGAGALGPPEDVCAASRVSPADTMVCRDHWSGQKPVRGRAELCTESWSRA
jgi:hypothetical protein